jgi:hypothetical protein
LQEHKHTGNGTVTGNMRRQRAMKNIHILRVALEEEFNEEWNDDNDDDDNEKEDDK